MGERDRRPSACSRTARRCRTRRRNRCPRVALAEDRLVRAEAARHGDLRDASSSARPASRRPVPGEHRTVSCPRAHARRSHTGSSALSRRRRRVGARRERRRATHESERNARREADQHDARGHLEHPQRVVRGVAGGPLPAAGALGCPLPATVTSTRLKFARRRSEFSSPLSGGDLRAVVAQPCLESVDLLGGRGALRGP